jgi:hypothetical protein
MLLFNGRGRRYARERGKLLPVRACLALGFEINKFLRRNIAPRLSHHYPLFRSRNIQK